VNSRGNPCCWPVGLRFSALVWTLGCDTHEKQDFVFTFYRYLFQACFLRHSDEKFLKTFDRVLSLQRMELVFYKFNGTSGHSFLLKLKCEKLGFGWNSSGVLKQASGELALASLDWLLAPQRSGNYSINAVKCIRSWIWYGKLLPAPWDPWQAQETSKAPKSTSIAALFTYTGCRSIS